MHGRLTSEVRTVCKRCWRGLIDDSHYVKSCDLSCILSRAFLRIVEIATKDVLVVTQISLSILLTQVRWQPLWS